MGTITKPYTFTNGAGNIIDAPQVNADFDTVYTLVNGNIQAINLKAGDGLFDSYKSVFETHSEATSLSMNAAGNWFASTNGGLAGDTANPAPRMIYLDDADYAVVGKTLKWRLRVAVMVNSFGPAQTFTAGLYPVTSFNSGLGNQINGDIGAVVAGSTVVFGPGLAALSNNQGNSGDFNHPGDGYYVPGVQSSAGLTASSSLLFAFQLQVRAV